MMATAKAAEARAQVQKAYYDIGGPVFASAEFTFTKVFIDYKAWDAIPDEGDIAVAELADKIGGSHELVDRIVTFFFAAKTLDNPAPGRVAHTEKSRLYKSDQPTAWLYVHMFNNVFRSWAQMPTFFAKNGLSSPESVNFTPLGLAHGFEDKPAYEIIVADKTVHKGFNEALRSIGAMYSLRGVYDFSWLRGPLGGETQGRPALVDVGGSHGLALLDAMRNNPFIPPGRMVLFDLPQVVENTKAHHLNAELQRAQLVGGSMFEPYPDGVRGSLIYQFRRVLNDFPDQDVVRAFKNVREAAAPDTRILVIEELLSEKRLPMNVVLDVCLLCAAGKRRNAAMYGKLAEQAGFRLNGEFQHVNSQFDDFSVLEFVVA